jgi:DNA-binding NtrC family response regulator
MSIVLIADDNDSVVSALSTLLELNDIDNICANSPAQVIKILSSRDDVGLVLQDMNFDAGEHSGRQGRDLFHQIHDLYPHIPVVLMTAWTQLEMAVELIKKGAADYLAKPWDDNKLLATIENLLELSELKLAQMRRSQKLNEARRDLEQRANLCGLVYQSEAMHSLVELAVRVARSDLPILISGSNGSGKEKIAEIVQANSLVKNGPFIKVNAGALPDELMEAELFGAEAGAYTGVSKMRQGRFELADGGTLFLDELGNLSANGQAKLLRVLQTGEFERLGSSETRRCRVRLISATNADLKSAVERGEFREDLYYRLNVIELCLPALKERNEDILPLLRLFIGAGKNVDPHALKALQRYPWPGNVRELENSCQRAAVIAHGDTLTLSDFGLSEVPSLTDSKSKSPEVSAELIEDVLRENCGVVAQAARQLGMSRQALYRRIEKYGIKV